MGSLSEHEGMWDEVWMTLCKRTYVPQGKCVCGYHDSIFVGYEEVPDLCEREFFPKGECVCGYHDLPQSKTTYEEALKMCRPIDIKAEEAKATAQERIWVDLEYKMRLHEEYEKGGAIAQQLRYENIYG